MIFEAVELHEESQHHDAGRFTCERHASVECASFYIGREYSVVGHAESERISLSAIEAAPPRVDRNVWSQNGTSIVSCSGSDV